MKILLPNRCVINCIIGGFCLIVCITIFENNKALRVILRLFTFLLDIAGLYYLDDYCGFFSFLLKLFKRAVESSNFLFFRVHYRQSFIGLIGLPGVNFKNSCTKQLLANIAVNHYVGIWRFFYEKIVVVSLLVRSYEIGVNFFLEFVSGLDYEGGLLFVEGS